MELNFKITEDFVNKLPEKEFETFERMQDGETLRIYKLKPIIAKAMVDEKGLPVPFKKAFEILGDIPIGDYEQVIKAFTDGLMNAAVPKANGDSLNSPSEVPSTASESPAGSE